MIDNIIRIIGEVVVFALGAGIGAMWGISQHVELLDWLEARTIRRWMQAMQSLGYEQWRIDQVLEQMGQRIMVNIPPPPEPPVKKPSLDDQLNELHIGVAWHWTVADEDKPIIQQLCINYGKELQEAAKSGSNVMLDDMAEILRKEWLKVTNHDYGLRDPYVNVNAGNYDSDGRIFVLFEIR